MSDHECMKNRELDKLDRQTDNNSKEIGDLKVMFQKMMDKIDTVLEDIKSITNTTDDHNERISKLENTTQKILWLINYTLLLRI